MRLLITGLLLSMTLYSVAQRLEVSDNGRYLVTNDGKPFFWLADTAWELLHRCDRDEIDMYLQTRHDQGFNVIQTVALAELDGLQTPNPYGQVPLVDLDPAKPNPKYFEHVDYLLDKSRSLNMYIALLPTWGDKLFTNSWGVGPEVLNEENAFAYGKWIGERYKDHENIIWVVGGDRNPRNETDVDVWRALAKGIETGVGGSEKALMTFHPQPKEGGGSSTWFHQDAWLDFNMHQTGHCANQGTYKHIIHDYKLSPIKPVLDGEPLYEDHPNCFNARELGHSAAEDIRRIMYWNVFSGAFGQTYGCHDVWQMYDLDKEPINQPLRPWKEALQMPMARQVKHLKHLMLSRPFLKRIPRPELVTSSHEEMEQVVATGDPEGTYAMIYFPKSGANLNLSLLQGASLDSWWYDPRTGAAFKGAELPVSTNVQVTPPSTGKGNDWVLVINSSESSYPLPGTVFE